MMGKEWAIIYALVDPRTMKIRYVGKTKPGITRVSEHISSSVNKRTKKERWINKLVKLGLRPIMDILESCDHLVWQERERYWIKYYRENGCDLCNHTDGGEGLNNCSEETKEKQRANNKRNAHIYKTKEFREKIGKLSRELVRTPEHCANIAKSLTGKPRPDFAAMNTRVHAGNTYRLGVPHTEKSKLKNMMSQKKRTPIIMMDKMGNVAYYNSCAECSRETGFNKLMIRRYLNRDKPYKGFILKTTIENV